MIDLFSALLSGVGVLFFIASTVGLLRFPDVYCRLHALTKADNVGLGLIVLGLMLRAEDPGVALKLALIWFSVIISSSSSCYLIAHAARLMGIKPWMRSE